VKKIRLKTATGSGSDTKIFREVTALSRLSHRFIVRYFTTWVETSDEPVSTVASDDSHSGVSEPGSGTGGGMTSVPTSSQLSNGTSSSSSSERHLPTHAGAIPTIEFDFSNRRSLSSKSSFPSIHFGGGSSSSGSGSGSVDEDGDADGVGLGFGLTRKRDGNFLPVAKTPKATNAPRLGNGVTGPRTLYIQMVGCSLASMPWYVLDEG